MFIESFNLCLFSAIFSLFESLALKVTFGINRNGKPLDGTSSSIRFPKGATHLFSFFTLLSGSFP